MSVLQGGNIISSIINLQNPQQAFGSKFEPPPFSWTKALTAGGEWNLANMPLFAKQAEAANQINIAEWQRTIQGLGSKIQEWFPNYQAELRGELPQDVQNVIQNKAAAWGVGSGMQGGIGNRTARDIGMTSYQIQKNAQNALSRWYMQAGAPKTMGAESFMASPAMAFQGAKTEWGIEFLKRAMAAAPDPEYIGTVNAYMNSIFSIENTVNGLLDTVFSSGGGGGGGGGGGMGGILGAIIGG